MFVLSVCFVWNPEESANDSFAVALRLSNLKQSLHFGLFGPVTMIPGFRSNISPQPTIEFKKTSMSKMLTP